MSRRRIFLLASATFIFLATDFPKPTGHVVDQAQILSTQTEKSLTDKIVQYKEKTSIEIAVVTTKSLDGQDIEGYLQAMVDEGGWKVGKKEEDNGLIILVAPNEKKARIATGYGLEAILNDAKLGRIIRDDMIPHFKQRNFDRGIEAAVNQVIENLGDKQFQEHLNARKVADKPLSVGWSIFWVIIIILIVFVILVLLTNSGIDLSGSSGSGWSSSSSGGGSSRGSDFSFGGGSFGGGGASGSW